MASDSRPVSHRQLTLPVTTLFRRLWLPGYSRLALVLLPLFFLAALAMCRRPEPDPPGPVVAGVAKILVAADGFYHVTLDDLQEVGLDGPLTQATLHLSQGGTAVPYLLTENSLIFYGQTPTSRYSAVRPYLLETGRAGLLMAESDAAPTDSPTTGIISQTLHLEENHVYDSRAHIANGREPWFWGTLQVQGRLPLTFELPATPAAEATIRLALWGASHNPAISDDHDFDLLLNDQSLGTVRWDGETHFIAELPIPAGALHQGENQLTLDNAVEGVTLVDVMRLDWIELDYTIPAEATDNQLTFAAAGETLALSGFSQQPYLFDLTDPAAPIQLTDWQWENDEARFSAAPGRPLAAVTPDTLRRPATITGLRQSNWRDTTHQADLLIITTDNLAPALEPLVAARQEQGLAVALVSVAELYDEFGYGEESPDSIHAFVSHAYQEWAEPAPRYLLLVGDATYDYRAYDGESLPNHLPTFIIPVEYSGETISDARLADVTGDARPELAVGRWPVSSRAEVDGLVERTLAYEQAETAARALFSADGTSSEFSTLSDTILADSTFPAEQVAKLYGTPAAQLLQEWANGSWLVSYTGHGSLDRWGKDDVFSVEAVSQLESAGAPPIVVQFTCLTGFFAHPQTPSISEALLHHEQGPVLLVAATSLTLSSSQQPFAVSLLQALQDPQVERIGDALQTAKLSLDVANNDNLREISDTFGLLGDPSTIIQRP
jgi:hypothetical protein